LLKVPCKLSLLVEIEVDSFSRVEIISAKRRDKNLPNAEVKTCQLKIFWPLMPGSMKIKWAKHHYLWSSQADSMLAGATTAFWLCRYKSTDNPDFEIEVRVE
jgi:hypothetical protein